MEATTQVQVRAIPLLDGRATGVGEAVVHNTFSETFENGLMYRYSVRVRREIGGWGNEKSALLYDHFIIRIEEKTFHYGQPIATREETTTSRMTPWTEGPVPIMDFGYIGSKAIAFFILGQGHAFYGPEVESEELLDKAATANLEKIGPVELEELLAKLGKQKKLVKKFLPEKFVFIIADAEELLKKKEKLIPS